MVLGEWGSVWPSMNYIQHERLFSSYSDKTPTKLNSFVKNFLFLNLHIHYRLWSLHWLFLWSRATEQFSFCEEGEYTGEVDCSNRPHGRGKSVEEYGDWYHNCFCDVLSIYKLDFQNGKKCCGMKVSSRTGRSTAAGKNATTLPRGSS